MLDRALSEKVELSVWVLCEQQEGVWIKKKKRSKETENDEQD